MEKLNSDPQNLLTLEEPQSLEINIKREIEGIEVAANIEEMKINESQTQIDSPLQNPLRMIGKKPFKFAFFVFNAQNTNNRLFPILYFLFNGLINSFSLQDDLSSSELLAWSSAIDNNICIIEIATGEDYVNFQGPQLLNQGDLIYRTTFVIYIYFLLR